MAPKRETAEACPYRLMCQGNGRVVSVATAHSGRQNEGDLSLFRGSPLSASNEKSMNARINELPILSDPTSDRFEVLAGSGEPGGHVLLAEIHVRKGSEPPLRRHRHEDLLMYVLDGCLTFEIEGQRQPAARGSWVVVPKGCAHGFVVDSVTANM
jgi:quercetin dioxygenase-like cupin family protein